MVLSRGQIVDRHLDLFQIQLHPADLHLAFAQRVLQVALAQIERVVGRWQPRRIRVPIQDVERHRLAAF